ncbi:hypothetical protein M422DRAFT_258389 [Sphaerobolus stellatus SS14]|uniref:Unplaced genomic scaffold SPHSTscaffold_81, whole genome shotgun sequence n=1 Tax=Sphaerobolus stellatus (strain SS14) TaxID=990650 RepID=A0A0C9VMS4_SPHS4|nr:hypothetical protein M422DRAFT_258389 [Sphaerobolus stellatus SS14]
MNRLLQTVLDQPASNVPLPLPPWLTETLLIPLYASVASFVILCLHILARITFWKKRESNDDSKVSNGHSQAQPSRVFDKFEKHMGRFGGSTIFWYMFTRTIGCLSLFGLALYNFLSEQDETAEYPANILPHVWIKAALPITYLYCTLLCLVSVSSLSWNRVATNHAISVLFVTFAVYAYRDIWPLATSTEFPIDASDELLWIKLALLTVVAVIVPLMIPRQYVPVDPKNPMTELNPELTASWLSLIFYAFLDPIIFAGAKVSHLTPEELPSLSDTDWSGNLKKRAFPQLDTFQGAKKRHLFFRLMHPKVFGKEYIVLGVTLTVQAIAGFLAPTAINRILYYLENDKPDTGIQPWFWIIFLFVGPMLNSLCNQWYTFVGTRVQVRASALLTQLIFEHSLRIRMKAEVSDKDSKGKGKDDAKESKSRKKRGEHLTGKINNLITSDLEQIGDGRDFLAVASTLHALKIPQSSSQSAFVGLGTIVVLFPIPGYIAKKIQSVQKNKMKKSDARVQNVIRMIKLFGWEGEVGRRIAEKREEELKWIWYLKVFQMSNGALNFVITNLTMLTTYFAFTVLMHEALNGMHSFMLCNGIRLTYYAASKVFSSMTVFSMFQGQLQRIFYTGARIIQGKVSLDRLNDFLRETELLDEFTATEPIVVRLTTETLTGADIIGFKDATFSWHNEADDGTATQSARPFKLRVDGELIFKKGCINLIVGPTGCGKTSMLMALLGEMHFVPSTVDSWFNLPREGGVAYAPQESWVQNATIRDNIVFGSPFDEERYKKVLQQCALEQDLELFEAADKTEIGERGLTLSGGQKARVTLARAVYSNADTILLDDILAALDVHTSKWIIEKCLRGDLIRGRTVILVTHNVALASPVADFVVSLGLDGTVTTSSTISEVLQSNDALKMEIEEEMDLLDKVEEEITPVKETKTAGKLIMAEEVAEGHVSWKSIMLFLTALGGNHPGIFYTLWIFGLVLSDWSQLLKLWFLGYWGSQYETHVSDPSKVNVAFYLGIYAAITLVIIITYCAAYLYYVLGTMRASRTIHNQLVTSVLGTTLRWLDETLTSRITTRCTQDIRAVDGPIANSWDTLVDLGLAVIGRLVVVVIFTPIFVFPALGIAVMGLYTGNFYLKAQMAVKREMSNAKAPLLAHLGAAIAGLTSVRAYGAQETFKTESLKKIDQYSRVARVTYNLNRWISTFLVLLSPLLWLLERIQGYLDIEHEPEPIEAGKPPASWPTSGDLRVENLSARYSKAGPKVLHDISFEVKSGERIGVEREAGKYDTELAYLALLRCIITEGTTFYDGLPTNTINLDALRSHITIIPQMPELLSGTLRKNLDPFEQHDDATLNGALEDAGLFSLQSEGTSDEGRITLDSKIASAGGNLSVGQRQIIALARAIIRQSKVLILDEATSAIDYKTDAIIQKTLRNRLGQGVTVLTIAHRLQTIMDADKILVLDSGRIAEFDSPEKLLKKEGGKLKSLVDESGDSEALYEMAEGKASASSQANF